MLSARHVFSKVWKLTGDPSQAREVPRARSVPFLGKPVWIQVAGFGKFQRRGGAVHFGDEARYGVGLSPFARRRVEPRTKMLAQGNRRVVTRGNQRPVQQFAHGEFLAGAQLAR